MTSSEQIRKWYHSGVVLNHADRGTPGYEPRCNHNHPTVAFPRSGGVFNEPVHPLCHEAFEAYAAVMRAMGIDMPGSGGVNHCRNIADTDDPSLHAYLCAVDLPPNSFKPTSFLVAIEEIRTNSGAQVFRNLSGDRMHDQIDCSPTDLATGIDWSTVLGSIPGDDDMQPPSWAATATQWHIDRDIYSENAISDVDESLEFHRQTVFRYRFYNSIKGEFGESGTDAKIATHAANPDAHHA